MDVFRPPARAMAFAGGASRKRKAEMEAQIHGGQPEPAASTMRRQPEALVPRRPGKSGGPKPPAQAPPSWLVDRGEPQVHVPADSLLRLSIPKGAAIPKQGYGTTALGMEGAVVYAAMSEAASRMGVPGFPALADMILYDVLGNGASDIVYHHDPDLSIHPVVATALQRAGARRESFCVAFCAGESQWSVGVGSNRESREAVCKIALAIGLSDVRKDSEGLGNRFPHFRAACDGVGISLSSSSRINNSGKYRKAEYSEPDQRVGHSDGQSCSMCQARFSPDMKFCGQCGTRRPITLPVQQPSGRGGGYADQGSANRGAAHSAKGKQPRGSIQPASHRELPAQAFWLELPDDFSLCADGLPHVVPAVVHQNAHKDLFSCAANTFRDILGEDADSVEFLDDHDGTLYPEIGEALQSAGSDGHDRCYCLAVSKVFGKFGVGVAGNWKNRERAARLALALEVSKENPGAQSQLHLAPEFTSFCRNSGLEHKGRQGGKGKGNGKASRAEREDVPRELPNYQQDAPPPQAPQEEECALSRDVPLWVQFPIDVTMPEILEDLVREGLVVSSASKSLPRFYGQADQVLEHLLAEAKSEVEYHDDSEWQNFPEVGNLLRELAPKEECFTLAIHAASCAWGVGVGMKKKNRDIAAKAALAAAVALGAGVDISDLDEWPDFQGFLEGVEQARTDAGIH